MFPGKSQFLQEEFWFHVPEAFNLDQKPYLSILGDGLRYYPAHIEYVYAGGIFADLESKNVSSTTAQLLEHGAASLALLAVSELDQWI
ncbi:hypothetical protein SBDP1_470052 [Syntrophobacter sp. SbD1]|nr:hypothetical protein SBDP1_470052 [Syntrophobacter sp. SbD1]